IPLPIGKPLFSVETLAQVLPASVLLYTPLPSPLPSKFQAFRSLSQAAAYIVLKFFGFTEISIIPVSLFIKSVLLHVLPPSVVLKTPLSSLLEYKCPTAPTITSFGFAGFIKILLMWWLSVSPMFCQVLPLSSLFSKPIPAYEEREAFTSPRSEVRRVG